MFWQSFCPVLGAVLQIVILGAIGFILVKRALLAAPGIDLLSRLVISVTLPAMMFTRRIQGFRFDLEPAWWIFPLVSFAITILGFMVGGIFANFVSGDEEKRQFLSLLAFHNSGYLPLALAAALLSPEEASQMFIYIFMFLLGFNLLVWSLGVHFLTARGGKKMELSSFLNPPVLTVIVTMALVGLGVNKFIPEIIIKPLRMLGDATLPLAMLVVGGSLAFIQIRKVKVKPMLLVILCKLFILPFLGLLFIWSFSLPRLFSLLLMMQLAMPSATSLSLIIARYKRKDLLISQGILLTHLVSLVSIPLFLSLIWIK